MDRIKVEQKRNDELVATATTVGKKRLGILNRAVGTIKLSEERHKQTIAALREENEAIRKQMSKQNNVSNDSTVKVLAAVREEKIQQRKSNMTKLLQRYAKNCLKRGTLMV